MRALKALLRPPALAGQAGQGSQAQWMGRYMASACSWGHCCSTRDQDGASCGPPKVLSCSSVSSGQLQGTDLTSSVCRTSPSQCRDCSADRCRRASSIPGKDDSYSRVWFSSSRAVRHVSVQADMAPGTPFCKCCLHSWSLITPEVASLTSQSCISLSGAQAQHTQVSEASTGGAVTTHQADQCCQAYDDDIQQQ